MTQFYRTASLSTGAYYDTTNPSASTAIPLPLKGNLTNITVNTVASQGPCYGFFGYGYRIGPAALSIVYLGQGTIRSAGFGAADGIWWSGRVPLDPTVQQNWLVVVVRNDTGSTVTVNVGWTVDPT